MLGVIFVKMLAVIFAAFNFILKQKTSIIQHEYPDYWYSVFSRTMKYPLSEASQSDQKFKWYVIKLTLIL